MYEPCDYLNLLRTYQMFLEHISVISSEEYMQPLDEKEGEYKTEQLFLQLH